VATSPGTDRRRKRRNSTGSVGHPSTRRTQPLQRAADKQLNGRFEQLGQNQKTQFNYIVQMLHIQIQFHVSKSLLVL